MRLSIENLAKLNQVELALDGITVVVGDNNTGKSTLGKTLWAMFQSFSHLPEQAQHARRSKSWALLDEFAFRFSKPARLTQAYMRLDEWLAGKLSMPEWQQLLLKNADASREKLQWEEWERRFREVRDLSEQDLQRQIVQGVFDAVFDEQFIPLRRAPGPTAVKLTVRGKELSARFSKDGLPDLSQELALQHQAFLIDSPDCLEQLAYGERLTVSLFPLEDEFQMPSRSLAAQIWRSFQKKDAEVVDKLLAKKKLARVEAIFSQTMNGTLQKTPKGEIQFVSQEFAAQPLHLRNLSQGLKAFALLQAAFLRNAIGEDDVLILDEPEIHLHPEWQLKYAEAIVLLQKEFHLTVLLTSHSPDFVQALRLFSQKHGLAGSLNGYLSEATEEGGVTISEMPQDNWDAIFERFIASYTRLQELRIELEEESRK